MNQIHKHDMANNHSKLLSIFAYNSINLNEIELIILAILSKLSCMQKWLSFFQCFLFYFERIICFFFLHSIIEYKLFFFYSKLNIKFFENNFLNFFQQSFFSLFCFFLNFSLIWRLSSLFVKPVISNLRHLLNQSSAIFVIC